LIRGALAGQGGTRTMAYGDGQRKFTAGEKGQTLFPLPIHPIKGLTLFF
jgi:hypothetical protein